MRKKGLGNFERADFHLTHNKIKTEGFYQLKWYLCAPFINLSRMVQSPEKIYYYKLGLSFLGLQINGIIKQQLLFVDSFVQQTICEIQPGGYLYKEDFPSNS